MIIKFIQQKKGNNRGRSQHVIDYIFGKTKHKHESHSHEITKEKIDYIGCSKNLGFIDPLLHISGEPISYFGLNRSYFSLSFS